MMALVVSLGGHGHLGIKAAHFTCLLTGMITETRSVSSGSWNWSLVYGKLWRRGKNNHQGKDDVPCGHVATELAPSTAQQLQSELSVCNSHSSWASPSASASPFLALREAQGLSLEHRLCLSFAMRCKSLRLELVFIADSNPGSSGKPRTHWNL